MLTEEIANSSMSQPVWHPVGATVCTVCVCGEGTDVAAALRFVMSDVLDSAHSRPSVPHVLVLVSDGNFNAEQNLTASLAQAARDIGIQVHSI